ncbi:MAG: ATP-binding protein [Thermoflexales bacterium]|nr:ATP-binding protein [Thermoflexales bacterium]
MSATLPNWRKGVTPHQDIREDRVSEALFAVNLSRAIADQGAEEYRNPTLFFERTHLTRTLKSLICDVLKTLRGESGANSVIHLQTNFGGGKTHAELALYHLLSSPEQALAVPRIADFLAESGFESVPQASVAALPCADLYPGGREISLTSPVVRKAKAGKGVGGETLTIHTLWGEVAFRLGGVALYELVRDSDEQQCAPGVDLLRKVLTQAGPNLILIDELLHYVDKAAAVKVGDSNLATQTLGFLRELTEAVDAVDHSVLVASLTASRMEDIQILTEQDAEFTLSKLEDTLRRVEDSRTPIEGTEIYDIVRTRLFQHVDEDLANQVSAAYSQLYRTDPWKDLLPQESRDAAYEELLRQAYPFHPSIIKVLYERWGSRPQFQLTRGTLRFLSHLLAHLWNTEGQSIGPLVHLADIDLADEDVRAEAVRVAGSAWEAIVGTDVAASQKGALAIAQRVDQGRGGLYARLGLTEGIATSVFMFTHGGQQTKPTPQSEIRLALAQPAIPLSDLNQGFDDCRARLYYYYEEDGGCIFKTEPNPNKVLADERANVQTDDARLQVERVVEKVVGRSDLFHIVLYGFHDGVAKEPGDVPDDGRLQMVVLPPRLFVTRGKAAGKTAVVLDDIAENYGKKHRMSRNMVLYLAPDSEAIAGAIERAMDWRAASRVMGDAGLMERFSESQREMVHDRATNAANDTQDHVRKAYNTVLLPAGDKAREVFELSYIPPSKKVLEQAEEELLAKGKLHKEFNPALLESRWASLWPKTATVITTQALWDKFARQGGSPILTGIEVLQATIRQAVERDLFGYALLRDSDQDKLKAGSYERVYLGPFDAGEMDVVEISARAVVMRAEQVYALFPPVTQEEVAMLLHGPRQSVEAVFYAARKSLTIQGRVDKRSFFTAICEGARAGLFGYADSTDAPVVRGKAVDLAPDQVRFAGVLVGEQVPLPITADEVARLIPAQGRISVEELYQQALATFGAERVSQATLLSALRNCIAEVRWGYAASVDAIIQAGAQAVAMDGYVGQVEALLPDTRIIRLSGAVSAVELASIIKAATNLSKLGASSITLDVRLELKGEVSEHAVTMALNELKGRVAGLKVENVKG